MSLREQLSEEMKQALRSGDKKRLSVLRMMLSELKVAQASGKEFDEVTVVRAYGKKLRKAADEYKGLNLADKAAEIEAELAVVEQFMPAQMDASEVEKLVAQVIEEKTYGPRDIGRVMKAVMGTHGDQVDGRLVQEIARRKLAEQS